MDREDGIQSPPSEIHSAADDISIEWELLSNLPADVLGMLWPHWGKDQARLMLNWFHSYNVISLLNWASSAFSTACYYSMLSVSLTPPIGVPIPKLEESFYTWDSILYLKMLTKLSSKP